MGAPRNKHLAEIPSNIFFGFLSSEIAGMTGYGTESAGNPMFENVAFQSNQVETGKVQSTL